MNIKKRVRRLEEDHMAKMQKTYSEKHSKATKLDNPRP